jgi:F-type H+-transporting ATPase subunit delta
MKEGILAQRYAKALFAIALERRQLEPIRRELYEFVTTVEENKELDTFLRSPETSRAERRSAITRVFTDRCSPVLFNFLLLLADKGRIGIYREIHQAFQKLYDSHNRRVKALAISAVPMEKPELDALKTDLTKALQMNFEIENRVDPGILGGLILDLEGKILDGSVRLQLERLREVIYSRRN